MLILSEAPFCPLLLLQLVLWILAWNASSPARKTFLGFSAGIAAGAATLMRPSWLLFTPFALGIGMIVGLSAVLSQVAGGQRPAVMLMMNRTAGRQPT